MKDLIVVALGGNAILKEYNNGTFEEQVNNVKVIIDPIINLIKRGFRVVITHGNGPQVGMNLIKSENASNIFPPMPLHACGAETQGLLGYIIQQTFANRMRECGIQKDVISIITQVVVDKNDIAFQNPTKPIGPFYKEETAREIMKLKNIVMVEDSGRGYRRIVPSPKPVEIVEKETIKKMVDNDVIVITVGGGGIPVVKNSSEAFHGVEAVIDKDFASSILSTGVGAQYLILLTGVEHVAINFGQPEQINLGQITVTEAKHYLKEGQFPPGSMGPKIEAAIDFIESGGGTVIITSLEKINDALEGKTGTRIVSS